MLARIFPLRSAIGERARRRPFPALVATAAIFLALVFAVFFLADVLAPYDYRAQSLIDRLRPPAFLGGDMRYLLGTDQLGRDLFSRLLQAIRFSLLFATLGTLIGAVIGTVLGFLAAHFRGWIEEAIMMLVDVQASLPFLMVALALLAFFGSSTIVFVAVMGIYGWEVFARLTRGMVLSARSHGYAQALETLGASDLRIYTRHILPNILSALIVQFTLNFPQTILLETSLSFLGLGVRPPLTSLGELLGSGRSYLLTAWWISVPPGCVIFLTTLSMSILGDWLRDRFDPALAGR